MRGNRTLDLIKIYEGGDAAKFWNAYVANLMSEKDREDYDAHKIGTMKLQPFYENAMDGMLYDFYKSQTGKLPSIYSPVGSYRNLATTQAKLMLDNDTTTFYTTGNAQRAGHWVGLDLGQPTKVENINIIQGRNSVDDVDYFDAAVLEASLDGKEWKQLTDSLAGVYVINWAAEPVDARYVRLRKLQSPKTNWMAVREFKVNPVTAANVGLAIAADNTDAALLAFDNNPRTAFTLAGNLEFERKGDANSAVLLLDTPKGEITVTQLDAAGKKIESRTIDGAYTNITFAPETRKVLLSGNANVFEIIQK